MAAHPFMLIFNSYLQNKSSVAKKKKVASYTFMEKRTGTVQTQIISLHVS